MALLSNGGLNSSLPTYWCSWALYKAFLNLGFLICKMRMIIVLTSPILLHGTFRISFAHYFPSHYGDLMPQRTTQSSAGASYYYAPQVNNVFLRCRKQLSIYLTNFGFVFRFSKSSECNSWWGLMIPFQIKLNAAAKCLNFAFS